MRNSCEFPVYFDYVGEDDPSAVPDFLLLGVEPRQSRELPVRGEGNPVDVRLYVSRLAQGVLGPRYQLEGEFVLAGDDYR